MTDSKLSAAAQTILDAVSDEYKNWVFLEYDDENPLAFEKGVGKMAAAAIRELADQVMPKPIRLPRNSYAEGAYDQRINDHQRLLAIATELENAQ